MSEEQIKDYLEKYKLTSEKELKTHIKQLKTNTIVPHEIIFSLEEVLHNQDPAFSLFSREKEDKCTEVKDINNFVTYAENWKRKNDLQDIKSYLIQDYNIVNNMNHIVDILNCETEQELKDIFSAKKELKIDTSFKTTQEKAKMFILLELDKPKYTETSTQDILPEKTIEQSLIERYDGINSMKDSLTTQSLLKLLQECDEHQEKIGGRVDLDKIIYGVDNKGTFTTPWKFEHKTGEFEFTGDMESNDKRAVGISTPLDTYFMTNGSPEDYSKIWREKENRTEYNSIKKEVEYPKSPLEAFKGVKETDGKTDYSEINLNILDLMSKRFTANKHKYPHGNMLKPIDKQSLVWAAFRHIKKMLQPMKDDPETYEEHLSAVLCNMSMILNQLEIDRNANI